MKRRIISLILCLAMVAGMFPVLSITPVHAATESQNNIVARADYLYNLTWTAQSNVYGWNYENIFYAGNTYRIPYGQPINTGAYIGYYVSIEDFLTAANTAGSVFYTSRSSYDTTSSVYYATDCSAFVSWCWGVDRKTTYSLPFISTNLGYANATNVYNLQLGDALNSNDVGHVVLVTGLTYDSSGTLSQIEITEQTPPQLKRSYYTPSELAAKYGSYYTIQRYEGTVPESPGGSTTSTTGYDRGYAGGMAGTGEYTAFGLDVSGWQGSDLDFSTIKSAGYDYVILRAGTSNGKDSCFETYYTNAKAAGLDVGAYYYSYALDTATAATDAESMISYLSGKTFEYPIYFDYEDATQQELSSDLSKSICLTFMDKLAEEGYLVGLYTGKYFSTLLPIDTICDRYEIWIAHYLANGDGTYDGTNDYTTYGPTYSTMYGMYQFTDSVWIDGNGPYDGDVCYKDYPSIVKAYGFNGYEYETSYADGCTSYPAHCEIEVTLEGAPINSQPCSESDERNSFTIESAELGDIYTATGLFQNEYGNYWYRITTASGVTGYIYGGEAQYIGEVTSDITVTNYDTPSGHVAGNIFYVTGSIASKYNQLTNAAVWIRQGFGTTGTKVTGYSDTVTGNTYTLLGSNIDNNTAFNQVGTGNYTYVISADYTSYYADGATTLKTHTGTKNLVADYFVVVPYAADQSTCSHSYTTTVIGAATCTDTGSEISACSKCGLISEAVISATDHSFGDWSITTAATCTADGIQSRTCSACGTAETQIIAATGHAYDMVTHEATCSQYAQNEYTCANCGDNYKVYAGEVSDWQETKPEGVAEALIESKTQYRFSDYVTKTSYETSLDGYTLLSSDWDDGTTGTVTYVSSWPSGFDTTHSTYATYHQAANKVSDSETDTTKITVDSDAVVGYLWYHWCASGYTTSTSYKTYPYTNFHAFYSTTTPAQTDRYDSSDGSYMLSSSTACSNCVWYWPIPVYAQEYTTQQKIFTYERWTDWSDWSDTAVTASETRQVEERTVYRYIMAELGEHAWNAGEVTTGSTCAADGIKTYTCTACGSSYTETIPATGHSYEATVTAPTCTEDGYTTYICTACGDNYTDDAVDALGHNYVNGVCGNCGSGCVHSYESDVTAPSCTEAGHITHTCTTCGHSYSEETAALGHSYESVTTDPTCAETGSTTYTCTTCGDSYSEEIAALGHSYGSVTVDPTCTAGGCTTYTCTVCGDSYTADDVAALGHSYGSVTVDPTCTETGSTTYTCTTCGDSYSEEIAALGHSYESVTTAPTCTAGGCTTYTCTVCGDSYTADDVAALGHSYIGGTCTVCGAADPDYSVTAPTIQPLGPSLAFKEEIYYNIYFGVNNPDNVEITEMGVMTWTSAIDGTIETAEHVCPGIEPYYTTYFKARTQPISAKNMGERLYIKIYLKLADGSYVYSNLLDYSARDYATNMVNDANAKDGLKALCVALMNYGAAAQKYFGYKTDDLMNAGLTAEQLALVDGYSDAMIPALADAGTKDDGLAWTGGYSALRPSVNFGGALGINYTFTPNKTVDGDMKLYVWTASQVESVEAMTLENASAVITMTAVGDGTYTGRYTGISAKNGGDTVYACGVYESDGTVYRTGVLPYSVAAYCKSFATGTDSFQPLAATAAVYTYYAKAYLAS